MIGAPSRKIIDIHTHTFSLDPSTGCFVSKKLRNSFAFRIIKRQFGIRPHDTEMMANTLLQQGFGEDIESAIEVDHVVILALDAVYRENGDLDEARTHFFVPNDYVFRLANTSKKILPGVSINPYRRDALHALEECIEKKPALVKWLPNTQGFNPFEKRFTSYFRILEKSGVPLLCHTGHEHTLGSLSQSYGNHANLRTALDEGVKVIAAHGGGWEPFFGNHFEDFVKLLQHYPNLYADTSALTLPLRRRCLTKLLRLKEVHHKLIHGSDYPLPVFPWTFINKLPLSTIQTINQRFSHIARDYLIKRALGFPEEVFSRAADLINTA